MLRGFSLKKKQNLKLQLSFDESIDESSMNMIFTAPIREDWSAMNGKIEKPLDGGMITSSEKNVKMANSSFEAK